MEWFQYLHYAWTQKSFPQVLCSLKNLKVAFIASLFILVAVAAHSNSGMQGTTPPVLGDKFSFEYVSPHLLFINNWL